MTELIWEDAGNARGETILEAIKNEYKNERRDCSNTRLGKYIERCYEEDVDYYTTNDDEPLTAYKEYLADHGYKKEPPSNVDEKPSCDSCSHRLMSRYEWASREAEFSNDGRGVDDLLSGWEGCSDEEIGKAFRMNYIPYAMYDPETGDEVELLAFFKDLKPGDWLRAKNYTADNEEDIVEEKESYLIQLGEPMKNEITPYGTLGWKDCTLYLLTVDGNKTKRDNADILFTDLREPELCTEQLVNAILL